MSMFGQPWDGFGLGFATALLLALWAIINIMQSNRQPFGKALWSVLVLLVPYLGFGIWLFFGPRADKRLR
jgi:hypothetical protein